MQRPAVDGKGLGKFAAQHVFIVDGDHGGRGDLLLQHGIAARRDAIAVGDEHDDRGDAAPRRLLEEPDFLRHLEKLVEGVKTEVDHLG